MTSSAQRFCAVESRAIGDPLVGTGAHAERNLLLSWPRPKWQRSLRQASDMPEAIADQLTALAEAGRRVNLIHRHGQDSHLHRVFLMPERRAFAVPRDELPAFLAAFREEKSLASWECGGVEHALLLCCTHGKKDKCCAKFGYRTYKAIAAAVDAQDLPFDVWESSHLGGCRLAASVMLLPQLRKYGRVGEDDVLPLLRSEAEGRPYLPCYRGDSRLTPVEQCAQVAALAWLQARGLAAAVVVEDAAPGDTDNKCELRVRWHSGEREGRLRVTCRATTLMRHDTCADYQGIGATTSRIWQAEPVNIDDT